MKNIHMFPTKKPSRLFIDENILILDNEYLPNIPLDGQNQHIYITNDEEIKEGDWVIYKEDNSIIKMKTKLSVMLGHSFKTHKKIILTTDQDLIKDGIQAIDDEFLEWFVKNPSCESVEVVKESYGICNSKDDKCYCYTQIDEHNCPNFIKEYKIIIPKEEPKKKVCREG